MSEHRLRRLDRHHKRGAVRVRGGLAYGCAACGWLTAGGSFVEAAQAHAAHAREVAARAGREAEVDRLLAAEEAEWQTS